MTTPAHDIATAVYEQSCNPRLFSWALSDALILGIERGRQSFNDNRDAVVVCEYDPDIDRARYETYQYGPQVAATNAAAAAQWLVEGEDLDRINDYRLSQGVDLGQIDDQRDRFHTLGATVADAADLLLSYLD